MLGKVVILMATYNGEKYLAEQLESIASQTYTNWELWVSDDGSTDNTKQIFQNFNKRVKNPCLIKEGPRRGFSPNFLSLIREENAKGDYYAYADQDDIWESDKLERAINFLTTISVNKPALYSSCTRLIDEGNNPIGFSPLFKKKISFCNALVQNVGGGNTMVLNKAALELLRDASQGLSGIISHDWWTYMLVTGSGNTVFFDSYPTVRYRQHSANQVGSNMGWRARLYRAYLLLIKGRLKKWNDVNLRALFSAQRYLTKENKDILEKFSKARTKKNSILSALEIMRLGIYRQTFYGNIGLIVGALFKKI